MSKKQNSEAQAMGSRECLIRVQTLVQIKETFYHTKETHYHTKETYYHTKETYYHTKETYYHTKDSASSEFKLQFKL